MRKLSLLPLVLLIVSPSHSAQAQPPRPAQKKPAARGNGNEVFQTQTLAKLMLLVQNENVPALRPRERKRFQESLRYANQEVSYVVAGKLPTAEKTLKIKQLQQDVVLQLKRVLAPKDFATLVLKADALTKSTLLTQLNVPNRISEFDAVFLKTDPLGGNLTIAELAQGTFSPDLKPKR